MTLPLLRHHLILPIRILALILDMVDLALILDLFLPKIFLRHLWTALSCHLSWKVLSVSWFMQTLLGIKVWWGMKLLPRFMVYLLCCTRRNFYLDKIVGSLMRLLFITFSIFISTIYFWFQALETKSRLFLMTWLQSFLNQNKNYWHNFKTHVSSQTTVCAPL